MARNPKIQCITGNETSHIPCYACKLPKHINSSFLRSLHARKMKLFGKKSTVVWKMLEGKCVQFHAKLPTEASFFAHRESFYQ